MGGDFYESHLWIEWVILVIFGTEYIAQGIGLSPATVTQSQVSFWIGDHPGWTISKDSVDVKHLDNFPAVQIARVWN